MRTIIHNLHLRFGGGLNVTKRTIISPSRMLRFDGLMLLFTGIVYGQHGPYDDVALRATTPVRDAQAQEATDAGAQNHGVIHDKPAQR